MAEAKIKTLYSDKEKTEKLYPRTKIGAISDNDGVGLEAILDNMVYSSNVAVESVQASLPVDADTLGGRPAEDFATKDDLANINYPVDSVNGKTGAITLSATDVGAHPNTWMPTSTQIGAAPAGYGLGGAAKYIDNVDLNTVMENGWYGLQAASGSSIANRPVNTASMMFVENFFDKKYCRQTVTPFNWQNTKITRMCQNGTWTEWEYENPPMELGKEYRTTKRHNGKPVYVKMFDCGNLAIGTTSVHLGDLQKKINPISTDGSVLVEEKEGVLTYKALPLSWFEGNSVATVWLQTDSWTIGVHTENVTSIDDTATVKVYAILRYVYK